MKSKSGLGRRRICDESQRFSLCVEGVRAIERPGTGSEENEEDVLVEKEEDESERLRNERGIFDVCRLTLRGVEEREERAWREEMR